MISKLPATYSALPPAPATQADQRWVGAARPTAKSRAGRVQTAVKLAAVIAVEAGLALAFVLLSLGIGAETPTGTGPDRPAQLVAPVPASPPDLVLVAH